jgi:hypothetical protein
MTVNEAPRAMGAIAPTKHVTLGNLIRKQAHAEQKAYQDGTCKGFFSLSHCAQSAAHKLATE